jgi:hypothetical protein
LSERLVDNVGGVCRNIGIVIVLNIVSGFRVVDHVVVASRLHLRSVYLLAPVPKREGAAERGLMVVFVVAIIFVVVV